MSNSIGPRGVGASVLRKEDPRLLSGVGQFVADFKHPRLLHLGIKRSEVAYARITSIDAEPANTMPGVHGVFDAASVAETAAPMHATSRMRNYYATPLLALAEDVVRYVGEPVAAVLANTRYVAEDALDALTVSYEPLPVEADPEFAVRSGAPLLHEEAGSNVILEREFSSGDPAHALASAPVSFRRRFRMHRKSPVAIENRACVAQYDPGDRSLTLRSTTQVPGIVRDALARALDIPGSRLRVLAPDVGGGFGGKASLYPEEVLVCALAMQTGRPVMWISDRLEDLQSTSQAFDEIVDVEIGFTRDGLVCGLEADVIGDTGAYSVYPWTAALEPVQVVSFLPGPYRIADYRGRVRGVATPKPPTGPYRGVGRPVSTFVMERLMDIAARELDIPADEIRRRNLVTADEMPFRAGSGLVWNHADFHVCFEQAVEHISLDAFRTTQNEARLEGRYFGVGIATYAELTGIGSRISAAPGMPINTGTESARLTLDSTGSISAEFAIASHGQGLETTLAQVVADELDVDPDDVTVSHGDSATLPHGTGTYASRSTVIAGGAAILGARKFKERIVNAAAHLLEAAVEDIELVNGTVRVRGTDQALTLSELADAVYSQMGRLPLAVRESLDLSVNAFYDPYLGTTTPATHAALVEVDIDTCTVKLHRYVVVEDCGKVINPLIVDGQVHGGVAQGIGAALLEEIVHDPEGQLLNGTLADYLIPSAAEVPFMDVSHVETGTPDNVGRFRGLGEGGTIGAPAAIANAVADALSEFDIEVNELPISPERLFRLLNPEV